MPRIQDIFAFALMVMFALTQLGQIFGIDDVIAQDEQFEDQYYEYEDEVPEMQENEELPPEDDFAETYPEQVDPEFMEEVEPGEYDQNDDVTDLNDTYMTE